MGGGVGGLEGIGGVGGGGWVGGIWYLILPCIHGQYEPAASLGVLLETLCTFWNALVGMGCM